MKINEIYKKFNYEVAIVANKVFASMNFFWFCLFLVSIPLVIPKIMPFAQYLSSSVLQLCALPLIAVGTILASAASDKLAKEQHAVILESHKEQAELMKEIKMILDDDNEIKKKLNDIEEKLNSIIK